MIRLGNEYFKFWLVYRNLLLLTTSSVTSLGPRCTSTPDTFDVRKVRFGQSTPGIRAFVCTFSRFGTFVGPRARRAVTATIAVWVGWMGSKRKREGIRDKKVE
jgi:hypothetical protein